MPKNHPSFNATNTQDGCDKGQEKGREQPGASSNYSNSNTQTQTQSRSNITASTNTDNSRTGARGQKMRVALYARYSDDQQKASSIDDQLRVCREVAQRHGYDIAPELVFSDAAISGQGASTHKRKSYAALREAVAQLTVEHHVRAAKAIDRLLRIAHEEQLAGSRAGGEPVGDVRVVGGEQEDEFGLHRIGVLKLVDENVRIAAL